MQNQSLLQCKIEYCPIELQNDFPVTYPGKETHSPSTEQIISMHYHDSIELGYCYKGCGIFFINGRVIPFSAGDASIIFPNEIHIAQSEKSNPSQWKFINVDPLRLLRDISLEELNILSTVINRGCPPVNIIPKNDEGLLNKTIFDLCDELERREKHYKSMSKSLTWSIFLALSRIALSNTDENQAGGNQNMLKIAPSLKYILENYMNAVRLSDISARCNLSASHFRRLFVSVMHTSPSEYLYMVRIKMASILLVNTDETISEISMKVGYTTLSSFNRHFKKIMGLAPKNWKKSVSE